MYANKEYAWENYTDDPYYGARRLKEYYQRFAKDRGVRYYFLGIIVVMAVAVSKLYRLEAEQRATEGLLGPKKKAYRSRLTIVLDVDETIVSFGDKAFRMKAGMVARPYLAELLDYLSEIDAEVVLWSACTERYMRQVLQVIDPDGVRISQYITKDAEWFSQDNYYEKNVLWLKRHLDDILMIENRPLSIRNCNGNSILVDDFIRGEYMDTGRDHPPNDQALKTIREIIEEIEQSGMPVPAYLSDVKHRHKGIKEIPCHRAIRQLPEELARGVFYFVGDKFRWNGKEMHESLENFLIYREKNKFAGIKRFTAVLLSSSSLFFCLLHLLSGYILIFRSIIQIYYSNIYIFVVVVVLYIESESQISIIVHCFIKNEEEETVVS
eukprot:gene1936-1175_t